jgi:hypothetical protein
MQRMVSVKSSASSPPVLSRRCKRLIVDRIGPMDVSFALPHFVPSCLIHDLELLLQFIQTIG